MPSIVNTIVLCYYEIMSGGNTSEAGNNAGVDWRVVVLFCWECSQPGGVFRDYEEQRFVASRHPFNTNAQRSEQSEIAEHCRERFPPRKPTSSPSDFVCAAIFVCPGTMDD